MFSPIGKKKILLQKKFGLAESPSPNRSASPNSKDGSASPNLGATGSSSPGGKRGRPSSSRGASLTEGSTVANIVAASNKLDSAVHDTGLLGNVMRKIYDATSRYRPDRDSIILKSFESRNMEYHLFRQCLQSAFWITYTDDEFVAVVQYFDPNNEGVIDGYAFMIAFTRLSAMKKDKDAYLVREKQSVYEETVKTAKERERYLQEKKTNLAVDYDFTPDIRTLALKKLEIAAKNFDPGHPSAPSTKGFNVNTLKASEFRYII
jgi:hypothetical protein